MAQVAAGCRRWIVSMIIIFLCFLGVNYCIIDERNQVLFSQAEYTFEEDITVDGSGPLPNVVDICYFYLFEAEGVLVNILTFTTDETATGDDCCEIKLGAVFNNYAYFNYAGGKDFVPISNNITQELLFSEEMCVTVTLLDDAIFEDDEQFTLTVVVDDLSINEQFSSNVTVTIQDNDCK